MLCILFYGILVRLVLVVIGNAGQWRALRNLKTSRPLIVQLLARMRTPIIRSQAAPSESGSPSSPLSDEGPHSGETRKAGSPSTSLLLLVSEDIASNYSADALNHHLAGSGFSVIDCVQYRRESDADRSPFDNLENNSRLDGAGIMLVMESWMPPINETVKFIKDLRAAIGAQTPLFVGLVGQGSDHRVMYQPDPVERKIWRRKLDILADPYLSLLDIGTEEKDAT